MSHVLLVEDDDALRKACLQSFELEEIKAEAVGDAESALARLDAGFEGICVTDVRLPKMSGLDLLKHCHELDPDLPVILTTGHGDIAMAVQAMRDGAYDFIEKPFAPDRLIEAARRGLEKRRLVLEIRSIRARLEGNQGIDSVLIGAAPATQALKRNLLAAAEADADVLLFGETGTGKEVCARALHDFGQRAKKPFVAINCGALPETVVESELFGHEQGAFTGAVKRRIGKFEYADGGTVFLDEIESMPLPLQIKLLRVIQERTVEPIGGNRRIPIDVRIVAATKTDLREAADNGAFREDLFYRINLVTIPIPPLRERRADIHLLFRHFIDLAAQARGRTAPEPDSALLAELSGADWPGNVRELRNRAERFSMGLDIAMTSGEAVTIPDTPSNAPLSDALDAFEKRLLEAALSETGGNASEACRRLGIARKTLYDKMHKHGIERNRFADN